MPLDATLDQDYADPIAPNGAIGSEPVPNGTPSLTRRPQFSERFMTNLIESVKWSRRQIMPGIQKRLDILRQIVGRHFGTGGAKERVLLPFLRMQTSVIGRHLVSRAPRIMIETDDPSLRAAAKAFQRWFAIRSQSMDLEHVLYRWAYEGLIYPVSLLEVCSGAVQGGDGQGYDMGFPYVDVIDPERAVWDMAAKSWKQIDYIGHRYTIAKDEMMQPKNGYDISRVRNLTPDPYLQMNELGYEKTETLSQDTPFSFNRLRDYIDVWKLYLPKEEVFLHMPVVGNTISPRPIKLEPYIGMLGPDRLGPFHRFYTDEVPGNLMASPMVHAIYDLHEALNDAARKFCRQAKRQKTNLLIQQSMIADADKVRKAGDGDVIPVSHPEGFKEYRLGGPDQQNFAWALAMSQQVNKFGGNFEVIGGMTQDAKTLGQEKLLNQNASGLVDFMLGELYSRTSEVCRSVLWYEWNSRRTQQVQTPIPGSQGRSVTSQLSPEQRDIEGFYRMQFSVYPYSMGPVQPQQRAKQYTEIFQGIILPSLPMIQQAGGHFDIITFAKKMADYFGLVDFDEVLRVNPVDPMQAPEQVNPQAEPQRVRPPGTGQYTRTNVGATAQEGQDQEIMAMMKAGAQNGQQQ